MFYITSSNNFLSHFFKRMCKAPLQQNGVGRHRMVQRWPKLHFAHQECQQLLVLVFTRSTRTFQIFSNMTKLGKRMSYIDYINI